MVTSQQLLASGVDAATLVGALEQRALFHRVDDEWYAFAPVLAPDKGPHQKYYPLIGWWAWKLTGDAPVYYAEADLSHCTCPGWAAQGTCKHLQALRYGTPTQKCGKPERRGCR